MQIHHITNHDQSARSERLEARVSPQLKSLLQKAAKLQGSSLSEFISRSVQKAANEVVREYQILKLSTKDSRAFVKAIFKASKPNNKLKSAYLDYKKEISSQR